MNLQTLYPQWLRRPYQTSPPKLSPAERLSKLGDDAANAYEFLNSAAAIAAYQKLLQTYADQILESRPEDTAAREQAYMRAYSLQQMVREMAGAIAAYNLEKDRQA
jgi:hypothetical protein